MYTLKGFFQYAPLVDNTADQIALFGELSSDGFTFAKDKQHYTDDDSAHTALVAFHSVKDNGVITMPVPLVPRVLQLGQYLYERAIAGSITDNPQVLMQAVLAEFAGIVTNFSMGQLLTNGAIYMPEWIKYKDGQLGEDNEITVWLSDDSFRRQYPEYDIEVIVPFANLDDFFLDPLQVQTRLLAYDYVAKLNQAQQIRGDYPYTYLQAAKYNYQNPADHTFKVPSYWIVLIYGQAGNNPDIIKRALIDYVLAHSTHTQDEWAAILPDLFITTEFIITPFWNQYSVPNLQLQAGIYSPILDPRVLLPILQTTTKGPMYTSQVIAASYELSAMIYKSLGFGIVGNPDNREGLNLFSEIFDDYILVTNDSPDFNRLKVYTQEWMVVFSQMVTLAEHFTDTSSVPLGFARVKRDGVLYVAAVYDNITFLVVAKSSLEALYPTP